MTATTTATLTALKTAETTLASAIHAAAGAVERIATSEIDQAMQRLAHATVGARARLADAVSALREMVGDLTADMDSLATDILDDLSSEEFVSSIEPATLPAPAIPATVEPSTNGHAPTNRITSEPALPLPGTASSEDAEGVEGIDLATGLPCVLTPEEVAEAEARLQAEEAAPRMGTADAETPAAPAPVPSPSRGKSRGKNRGRTSKRK